MGVGDAEKHHIRGLRDLQSCDSQSFHVSVFL